MKTIMLQTKDMSKKDYKFIEQQAILIRQCKNKVYQFIIDNNLLFDVANKIITPRYLYKIIKEKDINKITGYDRLITQDTFQRLCAEVAICIQNNQKQIMKFKNKKKLEKNRNKSFEVERIIRCLCKATSKNEKYNDLIKKLNKCSDNSFTKQTVLPYLIKHKYILKYVYNKQEQLQQKYKGIKFKNYGFDFLNVLTYKPDFTMIDNDTINLRFGSLLKLNFKLCDKYHKDILHNEGSVTYITKKDIKVPLQRKYITNIKILPLKQQLQISMPIESVNITPVYMNITNNNTIGIDVNQKHHFLDCSDGFYVDKNNNTIHKAMKLQKKLAKVQQTKAKQKKIKESYSKKLKLRLQKCNNRSDYDNKKVISKVIKHCKINNIYNIVAENLQLQGKCKSEVKVNNKKIKVTTLQRLLKMNDIKNVLSYVGSKNNINVHLVNAEYTSKTCSICGCIHESNRQTQEHFKCKHCGYVNNADINAAINIKNRVVIQELRDKLEIYEDNHYIGIFNKYDPKNKNYYIQTYKEVFENTNSCIF